MPGKLHATKRTWRDPDDAPELGEDFFERAEEYVGTTPVPRRRGRPAGSMKVQTTLRLDREVVNALRATGRGWQTRANQILRKSVLRRTPKRKAAKKSVRE